MSDEPDPTQEIIVAGLMRRLYGFAEGLGLNEATTRDIVERVLADMPDARDDDRLARARDRMLIEST